MSYLDEDQVTRLWRYYTCLHALQRAYQDAKASSQEIDSAMQDWGARINDDECV